MPQRVAINSNAEAKVTACTSSAVLQGLCSERAAVWFDCRAYERAESLFYMRLQEHQNGTTSSSSTSRSQRSLEKAPTKKSPPPQSSDHPSFFGVLTRKLFGPYLMRRRLPFANSDSAHSRKSLYDRAEATFYQNAYLANEPQSTPDGKQARLANKTKSDKAKEKKPGDNGVKKGSGASCHFLHADSERVWLERSRYAEAETRFYETVLTKPCCSPSAKMSAVECLTQERIWFEKPRFDEAERKFYERMNGPTIAPQDSGANSILQDIARARENIQKSLAGSAGGGSAEHGELLTRMTKLELENQSLQKMVEELRSAVSHLESRVSVLEKSPATPAAAVNGIASKTAPPAEDEDDDIDLFDSDEEVDEEAERLKEQRLQEYAAKKAKKPALIAKSSILLDVKPWDDETDMAKMEECVRSVQVDGLLWGASKLVPVGYGIKKLQINCVVEDDKVGTDLLEEEITKFEDYVQSVDVAAFNKI
ncbi:hypothetical protein HF521_008146 [Silurus meridionalis]|uniref:Elongation factor 1-delta n=2 Tax=Silurus meridionalis TaxID=175797 RepID=A0A8T0AQQ7_SILME|nr:hypothetical protein HF521_008146 [Silurus meridionalis]